MPFIIIFMKYLCESVKAAKSQKIFSFLFCIPNKRADQNKQALMDGRFFSKVQVT